MKPRIVITATPKMPVKVDVFNDVVGEQAEVRVVPLPFIQGDGPELKEFYAEIRHADALFVRTGYVNQALIAQCPRLRVITLHGAGVDQVDVAAAKERGIWVSNLPGVNANAVAELTLGLMLGALRKVPLADRLLRSSDWETARQMGGELRGKTVGLVGFGNIGQRVADLLQAFGVNLLYHDARGPMPQAEGTFCELDQLLTTSDIVSLHVPYLADTHHLISRQRLQQMKRDAILINTARGPIVDQQALEEALATGQLGAAALDVFDPEPLPAGSRLLELDNVLLTPHIAGSTEECLEGLARLGAEEIMRALGGQPPRHVV